LEEAKRTVAIMRSEGLEASYTKGQPPKRPFQNAFTTIKPALINRAKEIMKGLSS